MAMHSARSRTGKAHLADKAFAASHIIVQGHIWQHRIAFLAVMELQYRRILRIRQLVCLLKTIAYARQSLCWQRDRIDACSNAVCNACAEPVGSQKEGVLGRPRLRQRRHAEGCWSGGVKPSSATHRLYICSLTPTCTPSRHAVGNAPGRCT
jgi:hypothetical protein